MKNLKIDESSLAPVDDPVIALKLGDLEYRFSKGLEKVPDMFYATYTEHGHAFTIMLKEERKNYWNADVKHFGANDKESILEAKDINGLLNDVKSKVIEVINNHRQGWNKL